MSIRRAGRALISLLIVGGMVGISKPQPVAAQQADQPPLEECVAETRSLSVLFLVDTSQSLQQSDPSNQRVTGIRAALNTLATQKEAADRSGDGLDVFVDFISFGTGSYRTFDGKRAPWAPLETGSDDLDDLIGGFASANTAVDTDYVSALSPAIPGSAPAEGQVGALESLATAPADSCRLVVWFTDGRFDFDFTGEPKTLPWFDPAFVIDSEQKTVEAALHGVKRLCDAGGLADRLRSGPIRNGEGAQLAVVALESEDSGDDLNLAKAIAVGQSGSTNCGEAAARGQEFSAGDVDELLTALVTVTNGAPDAASTPDLRSCDNTSQACDDPTKLNPDYDFPFYLPSNISTFNLLAFAGDPDIEVELITPDAEAIPLGDDTPVTARNGAEITVDTFDEAAGVRQVTAKLPPKGRTWAGQWAVRFRTSDPTKAADLRNRVSLYVYAGKTRAAYRSRDPFARRGFPTEFTIGVVNEGGVIVNQPKFAPSPELVVTVNGDELETPEPNDDGTWTFSYDIAEDFEPDELEVVASLSAYLQVAPDQPKIVLQTPRKAKLKPIEVRSTPPFPFVGQAEKFDDAADQLDHTTIETKIRVDAEAPESGGCVRLDESWVAPPQQTGLTTELTVFDGETVIEPGSPCPIELQDGDTKDLRVVMTFDPEEIRSLGVGMQVPVDGRLTFVSTSAQNPDEEGEFAIPVRATVEPAVNVIRPDWWVVLLMTLISAAFPVALMYLANWLAAKVYVDSAAYVRFEARIQRGKLRRSDGSHELTWRDEEFHPTLVTSGKYRRLDYPPGIEFKGVMPRSPFNDVGARAIVAGSNFVVGPRGSTPRGNAAVVNPVLTSGDGVAWVFAAPDLPERVGDTIEPFDGTLTFLVSDKETAQHQIKEALRYIPDVVSAEAARLAVERHDSTGGDDGPSDEGPTDAFRAGADDPTTMVRSPFVGYDDGRDSPTQVLPTFSKMAAEFDLETTEPSKSSGGIWKRKGRRLADTELTLVDIDPQPVADQHDAGRPQARVVPKPPDSTTSDVPTERVTSAAGGDEATGNESGDHRVDEPEPESTPVDGRSAAPARDSGRDQTGVVDSPPTAGASEMSEIIATVETPAVTEVVESVEVTETIEVVPRPPAEEPDVSPTDRPPASPTESHGPDHQPDPGSADEPPGLPF